MAKKSKKKAFKKHAAFGGRMVMIGFGSIGQGVLPLIFRRRTKRRGLEKGPVAVYRPFI